MGSKDGRLTVMGCAAAAGALMMMAAVQIWPTKNEVNVYWILFMALMAMLAAYARDE